MNSFNVLLGNLDREQLKRFGTLYSFNESDENYRPLENLDIINLVFPKLNKNYKGDFEKSYYLTYPIMHLSQKGTLHQIDNSIPGLLSDWSFAVGYFFIGKAK
ncbi:MAG: hypothetical protein HYS24_12975 [Ignavibacteriales bacterium]|nr:hypothetical protein [Ignavibacteriales bacterium]